MRVKMAKMIRCLLCSLMCLKLIYTAEAQRNSDQTRKRTVSDPVSNFFSELGDLILDVDKAISVQAAPKVEFQDGLASQVFGPLQPRKEHFDHIQENYRTLQNRLGSLIEETIAPKQRLLADPLKNIVPDDRDVDIAEIKPGVQTRPLQPRRGIKDTSRGHESPINPEDEARKTVEKLISDTRQRNEFEFLSSLGWKALSQASPVLVRRQGDISEPADDSIPEGRIIGDALYSESRFDNYIRQLIRNHGRWVLDNPLLQRWRDSRKMPTRYTTGEISMEHLPEVSEDIVTTSITDGTAEASSTEAFKPSTTESQNEIPKSEESFEDNSVKGFPLKAGNYYRVVGKDGDIMAEEIDIVLAPESYTEDYQVETKDEIELEEEPRDTVILAFSSDGVPLKLRMGPEIENPVKYLHRVLGAAGVSLKVPVESYEDLEPVGKEVLLLGAGSGIITRAVYLDLSNPNELKSLLRTLMTSKVSEK